MGKKAVFNTFSPIRCVVFFYSLFFYTVGCRGGIQFTFPYFANQINGPKHGFARYVPWSLEEGPVTLKDGNVQALFSLQESEYTKAIWNYKFKISFRVRLIINWQIHLIWFKVFALLPIWQILVIWFKLCSHWPNWQMNDKLIVNSRIFLKFYRKNFFCSYCAKIKCFA